MQAYKSSTESQPAQNPTKADLPLSERVNTSTRETRLFNSPFSDASSFAHALAYIARETNSKGKPSQRARILKLLLDANGREVPLPEILALAISQYGSRVLELRRAGFQIINRMQWIRGSCHTWFRLVNSPAAPASELIKEKTPPADSAASTSGEEIPKPHAPMPERKDRPRLTGLPLFDLAVRQ